jgi:hypothetical protein
MNPAERYIASLYEAAVDGGLDVEAIRLHLLSHGVARSPAQVVHDLDHVFCFEGYGESHPAPAAPTLQQIDAAMGY